MVEFLKELGKATYKAAQLQNTVFVFASGEVPNHYYRASLEQSPIDIMPPEFTLNFLFPKTGVPEIYAPWPFHLQSSFHWDGKLDFVRVRDQNPEIHHVKVHHAHDADGAKVASSGSG